MGLDLCLQARIPAFFLQDCWVSAVGTQVVPLFENYHWFAQTCRMDIAGHCQGFPGLLDLRIWHTFKDLCHAFLSDWIQVYVMVCQSYPQIWQAFKSLYTNIPSVRLAISWKRVKCHVLRWPLHNISLKALMIQLKKLLVICVRLDGIMDDGYVTACECFVS